MDTYSTDTLLGVVEKVEPFQPFLLQLFFSRVLPFQTKSIAIDKVAKGLKLAPFVSPMVAGKAQTAKAKETLSFEPAYLKPKDIVDPERLLTRQPGEGFGGTLDPADRRDAIIADILMDHRSMVLRRLEWMAAQALLTGKVVVEGDNYPKVEVDFRRTAGLTKTLVGAARWGEAGVSPVDDLESWCDDAEAPVNTVVMGKGAWKLFRKNSDTKELLDTRRGSRSQLETGPNNGKDVSFKGTLGTDLEIWVYTGQYEDDDSNMVNFIDDYDVILGSDAIEGVQAFGAILSPGAGYQALEFYARHFVGQEVEVEQIESQSAPLIIPARPDASVSARVYQ